MVQLLERLGAAPFCPRGTWGRAFLSRRYLGEAHSGSRTEARKFVGGFWGRPFGDHRQPVLSAFSDHRQTVSHFWEGWNYRQTVFPRVQRAKNHRQQVSGIDPMGGSRDRSTWGQPFLPRSLPASGFTSRPCPPRLPTGLAPRLRLVAHAARIPTMVLSTIGSMHHRQATRRMPWTKTPPSRQRRKSKTVSNE